MVASLDLFWLIPDRGITFGRRLLLVVLLDGCAFSLSTA